jgi:hypothetical protein
MLSAGAFLQEMAFGGGKSGVLNGERNLLMEGGHP